MERPMQEHRRKVFNDSVHKCIQLPELCVKIIDTKWFQRLRYVRQLGSVYYVYPGASHNRFEHSIGTCYMAGQLMTSLKKDWIENNPNDTEMRFTEKEILCVEIAALCHDIGHGPFSHLFDQRFLPLMQKERVAPTTDWKHEEKSTLLVDKIYDLLKGDFEKAGLTQEHVTLIKDIIWPNPPDCVHIVHGVECVDCVDCDQCVDCLHCAHCVHCVQHEETRGRVSADTRKFLFAIVNNVTGKIDVDQFDYLARDSLHLGVPNNFNHERFIQFARIIKDNATGHYELCMREKEVDAICRMFTLRNMLHRIAYQHKTKNAIDMMITDALIEAEDGGFTIKTKLSEIGLQGNEEYFLKATDDIFNQILNGSTVESPTATSSQSLHLQAAKDLLLRIHKRDLYYVICQCSWFDKDLEDVTIKIKDKIITYVVEWFHDKKNAQSLFKESDKKRPSVEIVVDALCALGSKDFSVDVAKFDYGDKLENPVKKMKFYTKHNSKQAFLLDPEEVSKTEPKVLLEYVVRIYCRNPCIGILKMKMPLKLEQRVDSPEMSSLKLPVLRYQDKDHGTQSISCYLQLSRDVKKPSLLADDGDVKHIGQFKDSLHQQESQDSDDG